MADKMHQIQRLIMHDASKLFPFSSLHIYWKGVGNYETICMYIHKFSLFFREYDVAYPYGVGGDSLLDQLGINHSFIHSLIN